MFPTSIQGTIELPAYGANDIPRILSTIEAERDSVKAKEVLRAGNKISFRGGVFRLVSSWNVLVPVGAGEIEVLPGTPLIVRYNFSCTQMLVIVSLMVIFMGVSGIRFRPGALMSFLIPAFAWLWLFGMNYLLARGRLPAFIRRSLNA